jgi:RNase P/RNase MRP subunit p29
MNDDLRRREICMNKGPIVSAGTSAGSPVRPGWGLQLAVLAAIGLSAASHGYADKVVLVGGDIMEGTVTKQTNSVVILEHSDLGRIEIPRNRIESIQIDTPDVEIKLTDGKTLRGKIVEESDSTIVLDHKDLGRITIPRERIVSSEVGLPQAKIHLAGGDIIEGRVLQRTESAIVIEHPTLGRLEIPRERIDSLEINTPAAQKEQRVGPFDRYMRKLAAWTSRKKEKGWGYALDISLDTSSGNTNEQVSRLGTYVSRELPDRRTKVDLSYYRKFSGDELSDNKVTVGYGHDWLDQESVWFWFALGRYDYDQFESWQQRANMQVGPGYHLIRTDDLKLNSRLGLGTRKEWGSQNDDAKLEALFGTDFRWEMTDKASLTLAPYVYSVLGDLDDYRARIAGEWSYLFGPEMSLNFLVGALYEYQSISDPDKTHGDLRVYLGLRFGF